MSPTKAATRTALLALALAAALAVALSFAPSRQSPSDAALRMALTTRAPRTRCGRLSNTPIHRGLQQPANSRLLHTRPAAEMDTVTTIVSQGVPLAVAGALAVNLFADPERRRQEMTEAAGGDEMASVAAYFNGEGFQRWRKIYGETDEVNKVQLDIRDGHAVTVDKVLNWLETEGVEGKTVCDAGCGTGSLTVPLAIKGAKVSASDIAVEMTKEAKRRYDAAAKDAAATSVEPNFEAKNLEEISGKYDVVTCLDVMIHYPDNKASSMVKHLASLANKKLIISFAPKTPYYSLLKRIGELFPGPSKATRAYLHAEEDVERALKEVGWKVVRREMTATNFYFSRLLEAVPV